MTQKTKDWIYVATMLSVVGLAWYYFRRSDKRGQRFDEQILENLRARWVVIPDDAAEISDLSGGDTAC